MPLSILAHTPAGCKIQSKTKAGLLTYSDFNVFPTYSVSDLRMLTPLILADGTYSSGNCCRFTRHSLFIPHHPIVSGKPLSAQKYIIFDTNTIFIRTYSS